jgi:hypothetical protein
MAESVTAATVPSTRGKLDFIRDIDDRPLLLMLCCGGPQRYPDKLFPSRRMPSPAFSAERQRGANGPINLKL